MSLHFLYKNQMHFVVVIYQNFQNIFLVWFFFFCYFFVDAGILSGLCAFNFLRFQSLGISSFPCNFTAEQEESAKLLTKVIGKLVTPFNSPYYEWYIQKDSKISSEGNKSKLKEQPPLTADSITKVIVLFLFFSFFLILIFFLLPFTMPDVRLKQSILY